MGGCRRRKWGRGEFITILLFYNNSWEKAAVTAVTVVGLGHRRITHQNNGYPLLQVINGRGVEREGRGWGGGWERGVKTKCLARLPPGLTTLQCGGRRPCSDEDWRKMDITTPTPPHNPPFLWSAPKAPGP